MRNAIVALTLLGAIAVSACDFNLTDPNNPPPCGPNSTADQVKSCAVGVLVALRVDVNRWVLNNGILGREGYRLDTADPRFTTELLAGPLDPSNDAFGGGQWAAEYRAIQSGYTLLNVIGSAQIPSGQQAAVRGFVHTMQAVAFLMILNSHTEDSIPIDVNLGPNQPLAPFVTNDSAYKHVLVLLDSARVELQGATAFPFDPGPGFVGFNTPATFLKVNRAFAARVQAYRASPSKPGVGCTACWDTVLTNLAASFIDPVAPLDQGVYHVYSTGNQDVTNALSQDVASAIQLAHPMVKDSAETQTGGGGLLDRRLLTKVTDRKAATATVPDTFALACLKSALSWIRYPTPNSPVPMIRNEELFLLRAEANWFGATGSKAQAISDLNFIRQTSGNLAAYTTQLTLASTDAEFVNALLHERLYSLLYEGHRWVDMRRYGRLNQVIIDRPAGCPSAGIPKDTVFSTLPINLFEVQARQ
jgi:starch-binding outer membrane protein, SusD/RagB family